MAARIADAKIEEVQRANDIVDVVSSYMPLTRAGKDFKACCPFHAEKTPSFFVVPSKQIFKCFGCGKGGSVFQFVMATESLTFPEAVRMLAERAGIPLEVDEQRRDSSEPDRSRVLKTVAWAAGIYEKLLADPDRGRAGRDYLESRGFTAETVERFRLGLAIDAWDALLQAARKRGVPHDLLLAAGLIIPRRSGDGAYDRFRNRLMFPIFDTLNRPIAFGGRTLGDDSAKYLNSPDTPVFDKSRNAYGLPQAREAMQQSRQAIVVEGYTDCLMAQQVGIGNVVATLGTSLTRGHVRLLKRYVDEVVLIFDGDFAGQNAADRAIQLFLDEELGVRIATLAEGQDPCDALAAGGKDDFLAMVAEAPDALEFKWRLVRGQFTDADTMRARRRAVEAMLETLAALPVWTGSGDGLKRDLLLARMAEVLGIEQRSLRERLTSMARQSHGRRPADDEAPGEDIPPEEELDDRPLDRRDRVERMILTVLLAGPALVVSASEHLSAESFREGPHRRLYVAMAELGERLSEDGLAVLWSHLGDDPVATLAADLAGEADELDTGRLDAMLAEGLETLKGLAENEDREAVRRHFAESQDETERRQALERLQEMSRNRRGFLPPGMQAG